MIGRAVPPVIVVLEGGGSAPSFSDAIAMTALVVGLVFAVLTVLATALVPIVLSQRRRRREVELLQLTSSRLSITQELLRRSLEDVGGYARFVAGMAESAVSVKAGRPPQAWADVKVVLAEYEDSLARLSMEVAVFSASAPKRRQALIELGGGLGNAATLELLEQASTLGLDLGDELDSCKEEIRSRIGE